MTIFELIGEGDSVRKDNINDRESVQVKHGSILLVTNPPGQPPGQVQPFGPGAGVVEALLSRRLGGGANQK